MISFKQFLIEKRKNPTKNPKISVNDEISEILKRYSSDKIAGITNCFVSFTELDKLGINPLARFKEMDETPIGIYAYPAQYVMDYIEDGDWN